MTPAPTPSPVDGGATDCGEGWITHNDGDCPIAADDECYVRHAFAPGEWGTALGPQAAANWEWREDKPPFPGSMQYRLSAKRDDAK